MYRYSTPSISEISYRTLPPTRKTVCISRSVMISKCLMIHKYFLWEHSAISKLRHGEVICKRIVLSSFILPWKESRHSTFQHPVSPQFFIRFQSIKDCRSNQQVSKSADYQRKCPHILTFHFPRGVRLVYVHLYENSYMTYNRCDASVAALPGFLQ